MLKKTLCLSITAFIALLLVCKDSGRTDGIDSPDTDIPSEDPSDSPGDTVPPVIKLESLEISSGTLTPEFNPDTMIYYITLTPEVSGLAVTAKPSQDCNVEVNGSPVTPEQQYCTTIQVIQPETEISIIVSTENQEGTIYTLKITKLDEKIIENPSFETFDEQNHPAIWKLAGAGEFKSNSEFFNTGSVSGIFTTLTSSISGREILSGPVEIIQGKSIISSACFYIPAIEGSSPERIKLGLKLYYFTDADCISPASTAYDTMTKTFLKEQGVWERIKFERASEDVPPDSRFVRIGVRTCFDSTKGGTKNDRVFIDDVSIQQ